MHTQRDENKQKEGKGYKSIIHYTTTAKQNLKKLQRTKPTIIHIMLPSLAKLSATSLANRRTC